MGTEQSKPAKSKGSVAAAGSGNSIAAQDRPVAQPPPMPSRSSSFFRSSSGAASSSPLYQHIISQSWPSVLDRISSHPKEVSTPIKCCSYGVARKVLPLHLALGYHAPTELVGALLDVDPSSAAATTANRSGSVGSGRRRSSSGSLAGKSESSSSCQEGTDIADVPLSSPVLSGAIAPLVPVADPLADGWLPLHLAILYASAPSIVERLLIAHPAGAKCKNGMGMLPIHIACCGMRAPGCHPAPKEEKGETTSDLVTTVRVLLKAFPESVHVPASNEDGLTALEYAKKYLPLAISGDRHRETILELLQGGNQIKSPALREPGGAQEELLVRAVKRTSSVQSFQASDSVHRVSTATTVSSSRKSLSRLSRSIRRKSKPTILDSSKPTKLYTLISAQDWQAALQRVHKHPAEASVWTLMDTISEGSDIRGEGIYGCHRLPLHRACALKPPLALVEALDQAYPKSMSAKEKYGMLPLHVACQSHAPPDVVRYILAAYPDAARICDAFGLLPLHTACAEGASGGVLHALLRAYPEGIHAKDKKGFMPLHYIKESFHPNKKQIIAALEKGVAYWAAVEVKDAPLAYNLAVRGKWEALLSRLRDVPSEAGVWVLDMRHDADVPTLPIHAVCAGKPPKEVVSALYEAYPLGVKAKARHGALPLHVACQNNAHVEAVEALLSAYKEGATIKDDFELLPIHIACTEGSSVDVIEALLRAYPTSGRIRDKKGFSAVYYAEASFNPHRSKVLDQLRTDPSVWSGPKDKSLAAIPSGANPDPISKCPGEADETRELELPLQTPHPVIPALVLADREGIELAFEDRRASFVRSRSVPTCLGARPKDDGQSLIQKDFRNLMSGRRNMHSGCGMFQSARVLTTSCKASSVLVV